MDKRLEKHLWSCLAGIAADIRVKNRRINNLPTRQPVLKLLLNRSIGECPNVANVPLYSQDEILTGLAELLRQVPLELSCAARLVVEDRVMMEVWELPLDEWAQEKGD